MKKHKLIIAVIVFLFLGLQKTQAQVTWEKGVETFKINKAEVVDSTILTILDSAFTFLRLPPLKDDLCYYYILKIEKPRDSIFQKTGISHISLDVNNHLIFQQDTEGLEWFNEQEKALLSYRGFNILVFYSVKSAYCDVFKYIKLTDEKIDFSYYYKKDKKKPRAFFITNVLYNQKVDFSFFEENKYQFTGYTLHIIDLEKLKIH